jgi:membrane associated rhomboid family serine protease
MLEDRDYMREESVSFGRWTSSPTVLLLAVNLAVFLLQNVIHVYLRSPGQSRSPFEFYLALSGYGLTHGYLWQLLTFQFLHFDFWHFFLNSLALYIFGRPVEMSVGKGRFWEIYFLSGTFGGILQAGLGLVIPTYFGGVTMGASGGVFGLLAAFCLLYRNSTIRLFLCIPIRAYHFLVGSLAFALFFVLVPSQPGIAHAAHLGGMLGAIGYFHWFLSRERRLFDWRPYAAVLRRRPNRQLRRGRSAAPKRGTRRRSTGDGPEELPPGEFISREVDPILDKISAHGIQSLTPRERQILEAARSRMQNR